MFEKNEGKLPRDFYEGVLSVKNVLEDYAVPNDVVDGALDDIEPGEED